MVKVLAVAATILALAGAARVSAASGSTPRLEVPASVASALLNAGFPARTQCGGIIDVWPATTVPGCWLSIEWHHYSVHVNPHSSRAAARAAYRHTYNRWARGKRMAVVQNLVVYGFRVPVSDWQTIRGLVTGATQ
jgi:hypothetical protein